MMPEIPVRYEILQAVFAIVCIATSFILVFWNSLFRSNLDRRLQDIYDERERIRKKERAKLSNRPLSLSESMRSRPFYERLVTSFNLVKRAEDEETALPLRRAGFRGRAPVITYLALKLLLPPVAFLVALVYANGVLSQYLPFIGVVAVALIFGFLSSKFPDLYLKNRTIKRQEEMVRFWPDTLDLMLIAIEAGMSMEMAFKTVSGEIRTQSEVVSDELLLTLAELSYLQDRALALKNLEERTNVEAVRSVVTALLQSERYGTSIADSLRTLSQETRDQRMAEAERKAAALPPRLTVPMIIFFLPVLFAIIITPAAIQIFKQMQ